uniref:Uncharacterized protein n=1 Tax=Odontella aurita TaxID=265563 RepID=A0A7S4NEX2_9STRA
MTEKYAAAYRYSQLEHKVMKREILCKAHAKSSDEIRGLEHMLSLSDFEERRAAKERVICAVLVEQDRQLMAVGYRFDDIALAISSSNESRKAREHAFRMGALDAAAVAKYKREHHSMQLMQRVRKHLLSSPLLDSSEDRKISRRGPWRHSLIPDSAKNNNADTSYTHTHHHTIMPTTNSGRKKEATHQIDARKAKIWCSKERNVNKFENSFEREIINVAPSTSVAIASSNLLSGSHMDAKSISALYMKREARFSIRPGCSDMKKHPLLVE